MVRILVVDDDQPLAAHLCRVLAHAGWQEVTEAYTGRQALTCLRRGEYALCLCDLCLPDIDGIELLRRARKAHIRTDFLILTGYGTIESAVEATRLGAVEYLTKPIQPAALVAVVSRLLRHHLAAIHALAGRLDAMLADRAADPGFRVADLCQAFGISPRQVSRLFREQLRDAFPARLAYHRTSRAKRLLADPGRSLAEVAIACGFRDSRRLQEAFAHFVGVGPAQYRKLLAE
ncbi:MAG: response regulator [Candidatus Latescibacterota bacterium]|jgi:YesN/AraC family two-component response regulator